MEELEFDRLGGSQRLVLRKLLSLFRAHGWSDVDGAAIAMVAKLERSGGRASPAAVAAAAPADFVTVNGTSRAALTRALESLAERTC
ncbi:MAG TPA: hypothetical protein VL979_14885 [Solirubrobacteraceae bacterium]|nr:hypothetical protein [Solirubrobacteraceae bacterium]